MRLLQLDPDGTEEQALDFHPIITVVRGLGVGGRDVVIRAISAIAHGHDPGIRGLLEAHGVMLDLRPDTLAMLDLHADLDVVVGPGDIPGPGSGPRAAAPATARPSVEQFLKQAAPGAHPELDQARRGQADASDALAVLREAAERARNEHRQAVRHLERALAEVEQANAALERGPVVPDRSDNPFAGMTDEELAAERATLAQQIEELRADLDRIDRGLQELSGIDTRPIQVLLDAIANPGSDELVPSERAQHLADEYVRLQAAVAELEQRLARSGTDIHAAEQRLETARAELRAAEKGMSKPQLSPDDVAELEAAHEAVLEAERRASGRFSRNRKALDEALEKEQAILDRVGFPTWSAYVMGAGLLAIDPLAEERLEKARYEFEAAEANWAAISEVLLGDPEHRSLLDQLEAVYLEAFDLLGGKEPEDLEAALRAHREPKREVTMAELVDALVYQLELVGLRLGDAPSLDRTVLAAEAFLAETASITERVVELEAERHHVSGALEEAEQEIQAMPLSAGDGAVIDLTGPPVTPADVERLDAALVEAAARERDAAELLEAREALVDAATQVHAVATSKLMKVASELAAQSESVVPAPADRAFEVPAGEAEDVEHEATEFYLLARLASLRNVSFAGSVPLVVDDAFRALPPADVRDLLVKLERMADAVQIIYLTDDPTVVDWATEVGFQRAAVVEAVGPFA